MSYNGSGTFNINSAGQPVVTGTVITSTAFNLLTADLATGLTTALTKDGQTTPTANIPMGGFKITGLGAGTLTTDAVRLSQLQSGGTTTYITAAGTDTITGTVTPTLAAYATGQQFSFVVAATNTAAVTLNINSLGAKAVTRAGSVALVAGDMVTGQVVIVEYDGTRFQLINGNSFTNSTVLQMPDGVVGTPGLRVGTSSSTGLFSSGDNSVRVTCSGTQEAVFSGAGLELRQPLNLSSSSSGQIQFPATQNASANANTLDDYQEGTWTPVLRFGGLSVGITYTTQTGSYTKIGNRVYFDMFIVLSSKGSSVGAADIAGLPETVGVTTSGSIRGSTFAAALDAVPAVLPIAGGATIRIENLPNGSSTVANLTDTNFAATTSLLISGSYRV